MKKVIAVLSLMLTACSSPDLTGPRSLPVGVSFVTAPSGLTATVDRCVDGAAGIVVSWSADPSATATRLEISTAGTRDRAGHPWGGWFVATGTTYANQVPFGVYDIYAAHVAGGEISGESIVTLDATCAGVVLTKGKRK